MQENYSMKDMDIKIVTKKRTRRELDCSPEKQEVGSELGYLGGKIPTQWGKRKIVPQASPKKDDDGVRGRYVYELGDNLTERYKILSKLGAGTFCCVLECLDGQTGESVAIKVFRSQCHDAAWTEIEALQLLAKNETCSSRLVTREAEMQPSPAEPQLKTQTKSEKVLEKLGPSLHAFQRSNKYCRFLVDLVREFGRQILESIAYLHDLHLVHTDLKPENILIASSEDTKIPDYKKYSQDGMLCLPKSSDIKLIDFGSTDSGSESHSYVITTKYYRAPEVILGLGWSYPSDLWSVGCILIELFWGKTLFRPQESLEHLALMEKVSGPLPEHMIQNSKCNPGRYFRGGRRLNWPGGTIFRPNIKAVNDLDCLRDLVPQNAEASKKPLGDLLHGLLKFDPSERLTARQALDLPFFKNST
ncbi:hypothetical protein HHK36_006157 [Tetracentron sinense]|uniref:Protein kinase domain-containing protein n=1 Tax=Tetracentron sinense TaxID=13715 RepID=A0A834ZRC4_TETSI|nr:hypothetical protein HHK36_006157 [Tetracentron sinense]